MKNAISSAIALVLTGAVTLVSALPAQAQSSNGFGFGQRQQVIETYCDRNPRDRDCRGYYGGGWQDRDYNRFYHNRRGNLDALSSGLFGLTFGAIIGGAIANGNNGGDRVIGRVNNGGNAHVAACIARYRSYDIGSDTYMGYDGYRHQCNL